MLQNSKDLKDLIAEAQKLNDAGGDWDRRNRLKVCSHCRNEVLSMNTKSLN